MTFPIFFICAILIDKKKKMMMLPILNCDVQLHLHVIEVVMKSVFQRVGVKALHHNDATNKWRRTLFDMLLRACANCAHSYRSTEAFIWVDVRL